jgi:hypothetical protein
MSTYSECWTMVRCLQTSECKSEAAVEAMLRKAATAGAIQGWPPNVSPVSNSSVVRELQMSSGRRQSHFQNPKRPRLLHQSGMPQ